MNMNERKKMLAGEWYDANYDEELIIERKRAKLICHQFNQLSPMQEEEQDKLLIQLLGTLPKGLEILPTFMVDYGYNLKFGDSVFVNHHSYFMDGALITIGNHVFIGPFCGFYTANHPLNAKRRNEGLEQALPITIEDNVWLGANVTVVGGITIGSGSVIAAGSVVTKDIPPNVVAGGVPAKVIRQIDQTDFSI